MSKVDFSRFFEGGLIFFFTPQFMCLCLLFSKRFFAPNTDSSEARKYHRFVPNFPTLLFFVLLQRSKSANLKCQKRWRESTTSVNTVCNISKMHFVRFMKKHQFQSKCCMDVKRLLSFFLSLFRLLENASAKKHLRMSLTLNSGNFGLNFVRFFLETFFHFFFLFIFFFVKTFNFNCF